MLIETRNWALIAVIVGTGVAPSRAVLAQDDLDELSRRKLDDALRAELDDVAAERAADLPTTEDELVQAFVNALGDEGDSSDKAEQTITWAELEAEAAEAKTTVETIVRQAVHETLPPPEEPEPPPPEDPAPPDESGPEENSTARQMVRMVAQAVLSAVDRMIRFV